MIDTMRLPRFSRQPQTVPKASQSFLRKQKIESDPFCAGACTWHKILLKLQVHALFATNVGTP